MHHSPIGSGRARRTLRALLTNIPFRQAFHSQPAAHCTVLPLSQAEPGAPLACPFDQHPIPSGIPLSTFCPLHHSPNKTGRARRTLRALLTNIPFRQAFHSQPAAHCTVLPLSQAEPGAPLACPFDQHPIPSGTPSPNLLPIAPFSHWVRQSQGHPCVPF